MGNNQSDYVILDITSLSSQLAIVDLEKETKNRTLTPWTAFEKGQNLHIHTNSDGSGFGNIDLAMQYIQIAIDHVYKLINHKPTIIEVGAGNGFNSNKIAQLENIHKYIASDYLDYEALGKKTYYPTRTELAHDTILNYGLELDMLFIVYPAPEGYMDYYAIKAYEERPQRHRKFLIFIGEMGASDGTVGIFDYLIQQKRKATGWKLLSESTFQRGYDIFGGPCLKSVFLLEYQPIS